MEMRQSLTATKKIMYIPYDNNCHVIEPIFLYIKHLCLAGKSKNTLKNNCRHLLIFWQYLEDNNMDYISFIGAKGNGSKKAYENITEYRLWLTYPTLSSKVVPIDGVKRARKDSSVNQMISSLLNFYDFLCSTGIVEEIPFLTQRAVLSHSNSFLREMYMSKTKKRKSLFTTKVTPEEPKYVSSEDFELCWNACTNRRNKIIIGLMFDGGLRVSEVIGLHIEDLSDIHKNIIHIVKRNDLENKDAAVKYDSVGDVVVGNRLRDEIIKYLIEDLKGIDTPYLVINFCGKNKLNAMSERNIEEMVEDLGKRAGLKYHLTPHMFRHGCAMEMVHASVDTLAIATKLRHKNISSTQIYAKMDLADKYKVQEKLTNYRKEVFSPLDVDFDEIAKYLERDDAIE